MQKHCRKCQLACFGNWVFQVPLLERKKGKKKPKMVLILMNIYKSQHRLLLILKENFLDHIVYLKNEHSPIHTKEFSQCVKTQCVCYRINKDSVISCRHLLFFFYMDHFSQTSGLSQISQTTLVDFTDFKTIIVYLRLSQTCNRNKLCKICSI